MINHLENDKDTFTLAELSAEWEDAPEEPKECFTKIRWKGDKIELEYDDNQAAGEDYEKLKAWKRLKDKGFRFTLTPGVGSLNVTPDKFKIEINADMPAKWFCCDAVQKDLDDCFGGEE